MTIEELRKELRIPYANWNYANYEHYHKSPCCYARLHMTGSVSEHQGYECLQCKKKFTLNAFTGEFLPDEEYDFLDQWRKSREFDKN